MKDKKAARKENLSVRERHLVKNLLAGMPIRLRNTPSGGK